MSIRPCRYPGCRDVDGNPVLTDLGMCQGCQRRLSRQLERLADDWIVLNDDMPTPRRGRAVRHTRTQTSGHPAEWASDMKHRIAALFNDTHDDVAEQLGHEPPPHPGVSEARRINAAWRYLDRNLADWAALESAGANAVEMNDLHGLIRSSLGQTRPRQLLPVPCPNPDCGLRTMFRTIDKPYSTATGIVVSRDRITCDSCGHSIEERHYPFYTRLVLNSLLDATETGATTVTIETLTAHVDEDERLAAAASEMPNAAATFPAKRDPGPERWAVNEFGDLITVNGARDPVHDLEPGTRSKETATHIARHHPAREVPEAALKRLILEKHKPIPGQVTAERGYITGDVCAGCSPCADTPTGVDPDEHNQVLWGNCPYIKALADIYAEG